METIPKVEDIQAFLAVVAHGSFAAAATSLGLDPALVSKRVARLERALSVKLLARTTRRTTITEEGRAYAAHAGQAVALLDTAGENARDSGRNLSGMIRLAAPMPFGRKYIAPCIAAFRQQHPDVQFDLSLSDQIVDLVAAGFDMAIRLDKQRDSSFVSRQLADDRQILCASSAYLRQHGTPQQPSELTHHDCLLFASNGRPDSRWTLRDRNGETTQVEVGGHLQSDSGESLRVWALAGQGISLRSTWDVVDELRAGSLVQILPAWEAPPRPIQAVRPHRLAPRRVIEFTAFLTERLSPPSPWSYES